MQAVTMPYGKTSSRIVETKFVPKKYEMQVETIPSGTCSAASWKQSSYLRKNRCRLWQSHKVKEQRHRGRKICKCALSLPASQGEESPSNIEHRTS